MNLTADDLKYVAVALGGLGLVKSAFWLLAPGLARKWTEGFPRSRAAAWLLTAAGLGWVTWLILATPLGRGELFGVLVDWDQVKQWLTVVSPVLYFLIVFFMDELLAPRALGALMLLVPEPILSAARWHDSPWRLVMTVLAYAMVVAGIVLVLSPYRFRMSAAAWTGTDRRCRQLGIAGAALSAGLVILGVVVY